MKNIFLLILFLTCCSEAQKPAVKSSPQSDINTDQIILHSSLNEISGLATKNPERLFAHNDEMGVIYELNPNDGKIIKKFQLGIFGIMGDFEGLAIAGERFFLIESTGMLHEFKEGRNNEKVKIKSINLNFSADYEIEGLCYDQVNDGLLVAVKNYSGKKWKGYRPIFFYSLKTNKIEPEPKYLIDLNELKAKYNLKNFFPSGIEISPVTGNIFVISSKGESALLEISPKGLILNAEKLDKKLHAQPEGIAFLKNGTMIISDEKVKDGATLTFYRPGVMGKNK